MVARTSGPGLLGYPLHAKRIHATLWPLSPEVEVAPPLMTRPVPVAARCGRSRTAPR
jgi:hypothetical protein